MIRIFSFVASCAGEKSHTARFSDELAERFRQMAEDAGEEVSYERMTGDQISMKFCRSCNSCFQRGKCPLDGQDDMAMLKEKFLSADVIFFCSPVYLWEMSGMAKCVIDRISYWAHRYELAGKIGVILTTTSSSYGQEIADRMAELLGFMGLAVAYKGTAMLHSGKPNLFLDDQIQPVYEEISQKLLAACKNPGDYITEFQEQSFLSRKVVTSQALGWARYMGKEPWNEVVVCKERRILEYKSLKEYTEALRARQEGRNE